VPSDPAATTNSDAATNSSTPAPVETATPPQASADTDNSTLYIVGFAVLAVVLVVLFFLPSIIAYRRRVLHRTVILVLNFVVPWTGLGWIALLAWSLWPKNDAIPVRVSGQVSLSAAPTDQWQPMANSPAVEGATRPSPTLSARRSDRIEQLKKAKALKDSGVLTDEEFIAEKSRLLSL
jgi:hypothetical protein